MEVQPSSLIAIIEERIHNFAAAAKLIDQDMRIRRVDQRFCLSAERRCVFQQQRMRPSQELKNILPIPRIRPAFKPYTIAVPERETESSDDKIWGSTPELSISQRRTRGKANRQRFVCV